MRQLCHSFSRTAACRTVPPHRLPLHRRLVLAACVAAGLSVASIAQADAVQVPLVQEQQPLTLEPGSKAQEAFLKTIRTRFETPNQVVGEVQEGLFCSHKADIVWGPKFFDAFDKDLRGVFRTELVKAGYPVPGTSDALFDVKKSDADARDPPLQVGIFIKGVAANFCVKSRDSLAGAAYIKTFWQVYAPDLKKVVFETTTEGSYAPHDAQQATPATFMQRAFAVATHNLLADPGYRAAVLATPDRALAAGGGVPIKITGAAGATDKPLASKMTELREGMATVFGDTGSGSGFFIGVDGYLLTNYHVVGDAKFVKVKLPTGRDLVGEVLRTDRVRDVALVKSEAAGVPPMPLRNGEPNVGEDVYALGSPLGETFNTSLTRGVLSGYRTLDEQRFLQSDVAILPGNSGGPLLDGKGAVIGITVMGLGAKGLAGMNFFIPVQEALTKLGIEMH